jgi:hypothetical protein
VTFVYGCLATFIGVFIIAWDGNHNSLVESEAEDRSESIDDTRFGSLGRRKRSSHVTPVRGRSVLNHRHSTLSLGLSPAQVSKCRMSLIYIVSNRSNSTFYWFTPLRARTLNCETKNLILRANRSRRLSRGHVSEQFYGGEKMCLRDPDIVAKRQGTVVL